MDVLKDLDKIANLPVTAKVLSRSNYKNHLECHYYYRDGKTSKEQAIKERNYYFSFEVREGKCIIFQTEHMRGEEEWIVREAKSTEIACKQAIREFYKRYI